MNSAVSYDVVIIGGGVSGTALLYTLTRYTNIPRIALLEKYEACGQVNSKSNNNSQTLHIGDIETNYSLEKASIVKPAALMVPRFINSVGARGSGIVHKVQKMVLAVGSQEVARLRKRHDEFKHLYPSLRLLERDEIAHVEPAIVKNRPLNQDILALYTPKGHAVDYEKLAQLFASETKNIAQEEHRKIDVFLGHKVDRIKRVKDGYHVYVGSRIFICRVLVVNTDAYSLFFAKSLGYGKEFSLIPVAGNFYFSKKVLRGKVYTMQEKKLPFAAVHGDPDIRVPGKTRWGPTAKFFPILESGNIYTIKDYFRSAGLFRLSTIISFISILTDWVRLVFLLKNALYDVPLIGKYLFLHNVQKIIPSIRASDLKKARGFGGMRLQRVDINTRKLKLGEGKIIGDDAIFNMTPSPGASVCLFNGMRDAETIVKFFDGRFYFKKCDMETDFSDGCFDHDGRQISENMFVS